MQTRKYKILVIEDDLNIISFIQAILESDGYQVFTAQRCEQGIMMEASCCPDLVVLDLGLPDQDGTEFIHQVRRHSGVPILVLSARTEEHQKILALDLGANDYITKPFSTGELLARVRAALRAVRDVRRGGNLFRVEDMELDYDLRQVRVAGRPVHMTQTEYNILAFLTQNTGTVMTYAAICRHIWGTMDEGSVKRLQVNMANIRKKLGCTLGNSRYLINELGIGYKILLPPDQAAPGGELARPVAGDILEP